MNKEAWLNQNTTAVTSVENTSLEWTTLKYTSEFTLEKDHTTVTSVERLLDDQLSHKLVHTGFKPFPCSQCGMSFAQSGSLRRHECTR